MRKALIVASYLICLLLLIIPLIKLFQGAGEQGFASIWSTLTRQDVLHALWVTGLITLIVTILNVLFGVLLSLTLARDTRLSRRLRQFLNSLVDLPFAVSPVIAGLMIVLLLGPNTIIGAFFEDVGTPIVFALPGMVLATLFVTFPFTVREVLPVLQEIGTQQEEAAFTLGAGRWTTFWRVTFPSIRFAIYYGIVLTVARSLGEFGAVLVVSGNIVNQTQTATIFVYQEVENFNFAAANSVALVLALLSITTLLLLEWTKKRKGAL